MIVTEITLGAERKRPAGQYASDGVSAYVKLAVHPGDDVDAVIKHGRAIIDRALNEQATASSLIAHAPPLSATAMSPSRREFHRVTITGARAADDRFRKLGLRWANGGFVGDFLTRKDAEDVVQKVLLQCRDLIDLKLDIHPPEVV